MRKTLLKNHGLCKSETCLTVFLSSDSEGGEEVCKTGTAAEGGDRAAAIEDGVGASVFTGPVGR